MVKSLPNGLAILGVLMCHQVCLAQGLMIPGVGAVNRSMGGAATGNSIDSAGAMFFNPATLTGVDDNHIALSIEVPFINEQVSSSAFGMSGQTSAEVGIFPLTTLAFVYRPKTLPEITLGLGMFSAGGIFGNYPADESNPILSPPPPTGFGVGQAFNLLSLQQFTPTIAAQMTERFSFGISPIITLATLQLSPVSLAAPDDANGDGTFSYPSAIGTHPHYGLGFQVGGYYTMESGLNFGFSYKSPNWLEKIKVNASDELGRPRALAFDLDLPPVYSLGMSYEGIPQWMIAADVRYVDYERVAVLSDSGFNPDGSVRGVGWESVWSLSLGLQKEFSDTCSVRIGWFATENPVPNSLAAFNIGSPAYYRHILSAGISKRFSDFFTTHFAYYHSPKSEVSGPFVTPGGAIPNSNVTDSVESHAILMAMAFDY